MTIDFAAYAEKRWAERLEAARPKCSKCGTKVWVWRSAEKCSVCEPTLVVRHTLGD